MMPVSLEIARIGWGRAHVIQIVSNYSALHFYFEIITSWFGNCVIKQLEMQGRSWPPAAV
jgi:hypothetical protein